MAILDGSSILAAFARLGERLNSDHDIEILIIGGAAGILLRELPAAWTTSDVDMIDCRLPSDRNLVLDTAAEVGRELQLPTDWLNDWGGLFAWTLANDWKKRRVQIARFNRLVVFAASRKDIIAMKFIAHRERDLEHLVQMRVTGGEINFVRDYLSSLAKLHPTESSRIEMAGQYIASWEAAE